MNIEDHIPEEDVEPSFADILHSHIEVGDYDEASYLITKEMSEFFYNYASDPALFGLLRLANHVNVVDRDDTTVHFDTRRKCLSIPHGVAHRIENMHDIACLLLCERAHLIVNRSIHTYLPAGMDLTEVSHKAIYDIALSCWSIALSRCYCSSLLPERLYAPFMDLPHNLMHGLAPDQFSAVLKIKFPRIANIYMRLYSMGGQEQYHMTLNRMPQTNTETLSFHDVLVEFWEDMKDKLHSNEELEDMLKALLVANPEDGEDQNVITNAEEKKGVPNKGAGKGDMLHQMPVADLDVDSDVDQYLSQFMKQAFPVKGFWRDPLHGLNSKSPNLNRIRVGFDSLQHEVMLEANHDEDAGYFGSLTPPQHPTARDLAMHMQGYPPMLWETKMESAQSQESKLRYALYFDISGSMFSWFPVVKALIRLLGVYLDEDHIYGFSTEIVPIDLDSGFLNTTHGTDINKAIKHARDNNITHMIMITDMEDYTPITTDGIEHIILVATMMGGLKQIDLSKTCFSSHADSTKIDVFPVVFSDVMQKTNVTGKTTFNTADSMQTPYNTSSGSTKQEDDLDF